MDYFATEFYDRKDSLVIAEMQILKRLGFQTQCQLPYGHLVNYLKVLELGENQVFASKCWGHLNDMYVSCLSFPLLPRFETKRRRNFINRFQTPSPALYPPSSLALATIYLVSRTSIPPIALPLSPVPWWTLFDSTEEELIEICSLILQLYKDWGIKQGGGGEEGINIWRRVGGLPIEKSGVRERLILPSSTIIAGDGANGSGNGNGKETLEKGGNGSIDNDDTQPQAFQIRGAF